MAEEQEKKAPVQDPSLGEKLLKTRSVVVSGEINKDSADAFIKQLLVLDSEGDGKITVFINSPGGDVDAGFAMFDTVRFIASPVVMVGCGLVASAASLLYVAVPRERRFAFPNSTYLIHQPMSGMKGVATDIQIHAAQLERLRTKLDHLIAEQTGKDISVVSKDTERDHWMTSEEALTYGLVGHIITSRSELA
ncbi:MAG: ATP-dependent Clp protease proteolytic subunit [Sphaerochaeta sp.]|jgi:ATP-dependent Clp protease protease subunit|nr:ATP-dependent Clp protease proteolytic subunit [Sphaerochaeta sp.]MCH3919047.1 ATP-dependent Clp protease proteolytic subunit [Sphaerochaeta sp.]MCI2044877.1 ATP-dependent Clp protease proteolytic subunit [Sphaerochaeta sp.]MCI2075816.1 ATP-dependent Clp protease proteolytic subunit [Sphaerochaeta sp.]MCI2096411.1 ATP-dependent Clp protease proteolytic subunit [Sphaerochaeta sp.]